jgi:hypothetical protein
VAAFSLFSAITMPRLPVVSSSMREPREIRLQRSGKQDNGAGKRGNGVVHALKVGALRDDAQSSSIARTLAVPARKIACESARMILFMVC